jgi:drug/metabolite transporter (DMT)-like permease
MTNLLLYVLTVLIWGSTWLAVEFQLGVVAVEVSLAYRYAIAAVLAFAWCRWRGYPLRFGWAEHRYFMLLGVFLFGLNYVAAYFAQVYITSALNAIAFSSLVWMNIINARIFFGRLIERRTWIGASLGMVGIVVLFWPEVRAVSLSDRVLIGAGFSMLGALIASFGNTVSQRAQQRGIPVMPANAWGMFYGAILNTGLAFGQGRAFNFDPSPGYVISLLFLALVGSVVSFALYLTLLGRIGLERSGYIVVIVPIIALLLSAAFEGLKLAPNILLGVALALAGNVIILGKQFARKSA